MDFKVIATDFDGTLCENKWPEIGEPNEEVINYLKREAKQGTKIVLWTCRTHEKLAAAVDWCLERGLVFDAINQNVPEAIELFGEDTRKVFANEYLDDLSSTRFKLPYVKEEFSMSSWAEKEVEIACKHERGDTPDGEWDYGCACYESALKAYKGLMGDGHSGFSIGLTKHILNRLIEGKPLTPIKDTDDIWGEVSRFGNGDDKHTSYQCKRMSSLFKYLYADGTVEYKDIDRYYCVNINNTEVTYYSGLVQRIIDEMFPITMPYFPGKPIKVYCEDFLTDRKNGDFDTVGIFYAIKPDGEKVEINRFFKESEDGWKEIDKAEYIKRKGDQIS